MKLLQYSLLFLLAILSLNCYSQETITSPLIIEIKPITVPQATPTGLVSAEIKFIKLPNLSHWTRKNRVGIDMNEISFSNWNAGGVSSISGLIKGEFVRIHSLEKSKWLNELIIRYGVNKQDGYEVRKSDDAIRFTSTFGYRNDTLSNWYHSAKFNFNTQFSNGYNYPNKTVISRLFAPAYTFLGIGAEYLDKKNKLNFYISPLTMKNTLVLDQNLANHGDFGVNKAIYDLSGKLISIGTKSKTELGFLVTNSYKKEVFKNITMENRLSLYSDYINKFGNIDVDWELKFDLIVNQYVRANVGTHIVYDDDIKTVKEVNKQQIIMGPKIQLKQILGVGLTYNF
jgi:hypothetical protein